MKGATKMERRTSGRKSGRRDDDGFFLRAVPCRNCGRGYRIALRVYRGEFFLLCDCGTKGPLGARVARAVRAWAGVQASPGGKFV